MTIINETKRKFRFMLNMKRPDDDVLYTKVTYPFFLLCIRPAGGETYSCDQKALWRQSHFCVNNWPRTWKALWFSSCVSPEATKAKTTECFLSDIPAPSCLYTFTINKTFLQVIVQLFKSLCAVNLVVDVHQLGQCSVGRLYLCYICSTVWGFQVSCAQYTCRTNPLCFWNVYLL